MRWQSDRSLMRFGENNVTVAFLIHMRSYKNGRPLARISVFSSLDPKFKNANSRIAVSTWYHLCVRSEQPALTRVMSDWFCPIHIHHTPCDNKHSCVRLLARVDNLSNLSTNARVYMFWCMVLDDPVISSFPHFSFSIPSFSGLSSEFSIFRCLIFTEFHMQIVYIPNPIGFLYTLI